jgi:hypothetical protein
MRPSTLFIDAEAGGIDLDEIAREAVPIAYIIGLFVSIAIIPFALTVLFAGNSVLGVLLGLLTQFILAIGGAVTLLYIVARGVEAAGNEP